MTEEVRYHMLRPSQIRQRRTACPVAYIPIGTLEWHGPHNPVGADALQSEGLAILAAQKGGGVAFPPLWYGESRVESLMDANASDREQIAAEMGLPPDNFLPQRHPFPPMEQTLNYQRLLLHVLAEVESLGFTLGVLVAGHYPLIDHARAAVLLFNKKRYSPTQRYGMLAWACLDYLPLADRYPSAGDHAAGWETSHLLHLHPETVDLSTLPPLGQPITGVTGELPPQQATAEFGRRTLEESADWIVLETRHRLDHPHLYRGHAVCLRENLWKTTS